MSLAERMQEGSHLEYCRDNKRWESRRMKLLKQYNSTARRHCVCTKVQSHELKSVSMFTCFSPAIFFSFDASEYKLPHGRDTWFLLTTKYCLVQSMH